MLFCVLLHARMCFLRANIGSLLSAPFHCVPIGRTTSNGWNYAHGCDYATLDVMPMEVTTSAPETTLPVEQQAGSTTPDRVFTPPDRQGTTSSSMATLATPPPEAYNSLNYNFTNYPHRHLSTDPTTSWHTSLQLRTTSLTLQRSTRSRTTSGSTWL